MGSMKYNNKGFAAIDVTQIKDFGNSKYNDDKNLLSRVPEVIWGGGGIAQKGYFALFCFFFCVCKKWKPPPLGVSLKFWYPLSETL